MPRKTSVDIDRIMKDGRLVDAALAAGVREALVRHVQAGLPAVEWRDGRAVWIKPEEIAERIKEMDRVRGALPAKRKRRVEARKGPARK